MIYHRTANCLLTVCLTQGDKPTVSDPEDAPQIRQIVNDIADHFAKRAKFIS